MLAVVDALKREDCLVAVRKPRARILLPAPARRAARAVRLENVCYDFDYDVAGRYTLSFFREVVAERGIL